MLTNEYVKQVDIIDLGNIIKADVESRYSSEEMLQENCFIEVEDEIVGEGINMILEELCEKYGIVALDDNYFQVKEKLHQSIMTTLRKECLKGTFMATK